MFAANLDGRAWLALATALTIVPTAGALAHRFAGSRFFPATITVDDPFVADELSLPTASNQKTGTDPSVVETAISGEFSKRITSDFGFSIGYAWTISIKRDRRTIQTASRTSQSPLGTSS